MGILHFCKLKLIDKLFKALLGDSIYRTGTLSTYSEINAQILPCPFCGGEAALQCEHLFIRNEHNIYQCEYVVKCLSCGQETRNTYPVWFRPDYSSRNGGIQIVDQRRDAIESWNRRAEK